MSYWWDLHAKRRKGLDRQAGAFAILYAVLVVVLISIGAIVVDIAAVREDRRADRAAADSAALGGVELLDYTTLSGPQPYQACVRAWAYLSSTLNITTPTGACDAFIVFDKVLALNNYTNPVTYCQSPDVEIDTPPQTVGTRTITISWPVPSTAALLTSNDIAPGSLSQTPNTAASPGPTNTDGFTNGCDKLGVTIGQSQSFGLAAAIGASGTTTFDHSVARVLPEKGAPKDIAALNVLQDDCETLTAKGGGKGGFVFVGPVLDSNNNAIAPGVIAVESTGNACSGGSTAIDVTGNNEICASSTAVTVTSCIGDGVILSHALDPGGSNAYSGNASQLAPTPRAEGGINGWVPVTRLYGCDALSNCQAPVPNYIQNLATAYGGSGVPTAFYSGSQAPYIDPYGKTWVDQSATLCPKSVISSVVVVPAGYNYANCTVQIAASGAVIVQGGTLVIDGGIQNAGCLMMNVPFSPPAGWDPSTGCGSVIAGSGSQATTNPKPNHDAIVFIRGNSCPSSKCFDNSGVLAFPQTFVYSQANQPLNESSTQPTLWTAPDAGTYVSGTRTQLDSDCFVANDVNEDCVNSRFGRLVYWNEWLPSGNNVTTSPNVFAGQASLNVVGVFFTPRSAFKFTGGGSYGAAAAQFWSAYLAVAGGAQLGISPYEKFSVPSNGPNVVLIR